MTATSRITGREISFRLTAGLTGLFFLVPGLGFLAFPDIFSAAFAVQPFTINGLNTIRGLFGGIFLGMSFFSYLAATTGRCRWIIVPIAFLVLIFFGRLMSLWLDGHSAVGIQSLKIEALLLILLLTVTMIHARHVDSGEKSFDTGEILNSKVLAFGMVVLILFGGLTISQKKIGMSLVKVLADEAMTADAISTMSEGLHVALIGTGAPLADPRRAGFSIGIIAGRDLYVVDTGPGSVRKLELMKFRHRSIKAVLLTHFHSDHIGDLGELIMKRWSGGSMGSPLDIFGPSGVDSVVDGFNQAYALDTESRIAHHGPEVVPPNGAGGLARPFHIPPGEESVIVIDADGLQVTAFWVDHDPVEPAVGYRFDYGGRSVVISGDTVATPPLYRQAHKADLLIMEALQPKLISIARDSAVKNNRPHTASILHDIIDYHASPEDGAIIANYADVRHLIFIHILPPLAVSELKPAFLGEAAKFYKGPITVGEDGMLFSLPAGCEKIVRNWLL